MVLYWTMVPVIGSLCYSAFTVQCFPQWLCNGVILSLMCVTQALLEQLHENKGHVYFSLHDPV